MYPKSFLSISWLLEVSAVLRPKGRKGDHRGSLREILDTAFIISLIALLRVTISLSISHHDVQPLDRPKAMELCDHRAMMLKPIVKIHLPKPKSMMLILLSQSEN